MRRRALRLPDKDKSLQGERSRGEGSVFKIAWGDAEASMLNLRWIAILLVLGSSAYLSAQANQADPLTDAQQQAIAEAGIDPAARIDLYNKYINERADTIKRLIPRSESARDQRIDNELQAFSALIDELASNLDEYGGRKADLRKALKPLNESIARWQAILHQLPNDPVFEISRNDASDAVNDLAAQTKQLSADQDTYFKEHKDAKGQQREEPQ